jgi:hypothetical protein
MAVPCRQYCQYWGGKTYLKLPQTFKLTVPNLKAVRSVTTVRMKEAVYYDISTSRHLLCCQGQIPVPESVREPVPEPVREPEPVPLPEHVRELVPEPIKQ